MPIKSGAARNASGAQQMGMAMVPYRPRQPKQPKQKNRQPKAKRPSGAELALYRRAAALQHRHLVCGILDPFCPHAVGARLPGDSGVTTIPYTIRGTYSLSTTTANAVSFFFYPDWVYGLGYAAAVSNVTTIPALAAWPVPAALPTLDGRVVSAGFVVRNVSNAMAVEGTYYVVPMTRYTVTDTFTGAPLLLDPRARIVNATKSGDTAVVALRRGYGALDFHPALDGTGAQPDYQPWVVYFPPTSTVNKYEIEMVVHIEFNPTVLQQYFLAAGSGPSRSVVPRTVLDAADKASSKLTQVVESSAGRAADAFGKQVGRIAGRLVGTAVGAYFGGPTGALAGGSTAGLLTDSIIEVD